MHSGRRNLGWFVSIIVTAVATWNASYGREHFSEYGSIGSLTMGIVSLIVLGFILYWPKAWHHRVWTRRVLAFIAGAILLFTSANDFIRNSFDDAPFRTVSWVVVVLVVGYILNRWTISTKDWKFERINSMKTRWNELKEKIDKDEDDKDGSVRAVA